MTPVELESAFAEIELTRVRRELLFWTLRQGLAILLLAGATIALLAALVQGGGVDVTHVLAGTGAAGAGAILRLRPRE